MELTALLDLKVAPDAAVLRFKDACLDQPAFPTLEEIKAFIAAKGVRFGLDLPALEAALAAKKTETPITVAKSRPAIKGRDAVVRVLISPEGKAAPRISTGDKADFREIETMVQVKAGDVLAVLEPATQAAPGSDVFANPIPGLPGKDRKLLPGPNTRLSADSLSLIADKAGYLYRSGETLGVGTTYVLEGPVDFKTGNIHFTGDVHVKGGIGEGFAVEATGNILVEGELDGATVISSNGNVTLMGGCFGKGKGRIQAKGEVKITFARHCKIECKSLVVAKAVQNCQVTAFSVDGSAAGCQFHGGSLLCYGSVSLADIGAEGDRTEISILDEQEEAFRKQKGLLEAEEGKHQPQMDALDRKLRAMKAILAKSGASQVPPKVAAELKAAVDAYQTLRRRLDGITSEKTKLDGEINRPRDRVFVLRIQGAVKGTVNFDMFHIRRLLTPMDSGQELLVTPDQGLIARPVSGGSAGSTPS